MSEAGELDELIGGLVAEAARRRAAPDWPADEEARILHELRRRAPRDAEALPLDELVARVERGAAALAGAEDASGGRSGWRRATGAGQARGLREFALAAAAALRRITEDIGGSGAPPEVRPPARGSHDNAAAPEAGLDWSGEVLVSWLERICRELPSGAGRVLYADVDAGATVARLRSGGVDAYGLAAPGPAGRDTADVRRDDLLEHLATLSPDALDAVALIGPPDRMSGAGFPALVEALARVSGSVVLASASPWAWRARLGRAAELADRRPLSLDVWMSALADHGFTSTVELAEDSTSYLVVARRSR